MLGLRYDWEDGSNLRGRLSGDDWDLVQEARRAGGLAALLEAWNNRNNNQGGAGQGQG